MPAPRPEVPAGLFPDRDTPIDIDSPPRPGHVFAAPDDVRFVWKSAGKGVAYIVLVLKGASAESGQLLDRAVWGATVGPQEQRDLELGDGVAVKDGEFDPDARWKGEPGYDQLLVQGVAAGNLETVSTLVPFAIERPFVEEGAACRRDSECSDPRVRRVCQATRSGSGVCRRVCASNGDCGATGRCGPLAGGVRVCSPSN